MGFPIALALAFTFVSPWLLAACGPSMKNIVESDMRFEHCYRIDDDASTPLDAKRTCWRDWTARYTRGQERSRVQYAKERVRVLDEALTTGVGTGAANPTAGTSVASPPPSNPYAPPPSIVPKAAGTGDKGAEQSAMSSTPNWQTCSEGCTKTWRACVGPCNALAACVIACDVNFKGCMKTCF